IPITTQIWCFEASSGRVEGVQALLVCEVNLSNGGGAFNGGVVSGRVGINPDIVIGAFCAEQSAKTVHQSLRRTRTVPCT
ncbi:MFS transporter, partial [Pseudomonas syringae pv. tagetis]